MFRKRIKKIQPYVDSLHNKLKMCMHCVSEDGEYSETAQNLHEMFGWHHTYRKKTRNYMTWECKDKCCNKK